MDFCSNVSEFHQQEQDLGASVTVSPLDDLFSAQNTEVDVSLEWLSVFVEDCLSSTGNCLPAPVTTAENGNANTTPKPTKTSLEKPQQNNNSFTVPSKARSKRKRVTGFKTRNNNPLSCWAFSHQQTLHFPYSDPPLLHQAYWLADSELIMPKKEEENSTIFTPPNKIARFGDQTQSEETEEDEEDINDMSSKESGGGNGQQQPRRCTHCLSHRTPQWRAGPLGPKTLCNACGVRYKSGRLLPEYRPAKSPTFVSYLHSNSHKKVMEMRMAGSS